MPFFYFSNIIWNFTNRATVKIKILTKKYSSRGAKSIL